MTTDPQEQAFPVGNKDGEVILGFGGLTKREYFAALAMLWASEAERKRAERQRKRQRE